MLIAVTTAPAGIDKADREGDCIYDAPDPPDRCSAGAGPTCVILVATVARLTPAGDNRWRWAWVPDHGPDVVSRGLRDDIRRLSLTF